jgi:Family of unknown function (DUF6572)
MSVDQSQVIDIVSKDRKGSLVLSISDHLDWENTKEHLHLLQEKINTYLRFLDSGEVFEKYPDSRGRPIEIEIIFHYQPTMEARSFLAKVKPIVEGSGYGFRFEYFSATPFTI